MNWPFHLIALTGPSESLSIVDFNPLRNVFSYIISLLSPVNDNEEGIAGGINDGMSLLLTITYFEVLDQTYLQ